MINFFKAGSDVSLFQNIIQAKKFEIEVLKIEIDELKKVLGQPSVVNPNPVTSDIVTATP